MDVKGKVVASFVRDENGGGTVSANLVVTSTDGAPFVDIKLSCAYGSVPPNDDNEYMETILGVVEEVDGLEVVDYDTLVLAEAKLADAIDDLNHLGEMYAASHGLPLEKTKAYLREVRKEEESERKELFKLANARRKAEREAKKAERQAKKHNK